MIAVDVNGKTSRKDREKSRRRDRHARIAPDEDALWRGDAAPGPLTHGLGDRRVGGRGISPGSTGGDGCPSAR